MDAANPARDPGMGWDIRGTAGLCGLSESLKRLSLRGPEGRKGLQVACLEMVEWMEVFMFHKILFLAANHLNLTSVLTAGQGYR